MVLGDFTGDLPGVVAASIPGILVALLTYWLTTRRANSERIRGSENARTLLAVEMDNNAESLRRYWDSIHRLDKSYAPGRPLDDAQLQEHLAAMVNSGWVGSYTLPKWSTTRWDRFPVTALGGIDDKQLAQIDAGYRDLRDLTSIYEKFMFVAPEERPYLESMNGRFWAQHFAEGRIDMYKRMDAQVQRVIQNQPLRQR